MALGQTWLAHMKELSTRFPNLVLTQKWWSAPRWLLSRTLQINVLASASKRWSLLSAGIVKINCRLNGPWPTNSKISMYTLAVIKRRARGEPRTESCKDENYARREKGRRHLKKGGKIESSLAKRAEGCVKACQIGTIPAVKTLSSISVLCPNNLAKYDPQ